MREARLHTIVAAWPEGLSDVEAIQRLHTLCLGACDGVQDLADDARYKALRRTLLARDDLRPLAPSFVAAQPNIEAVVRHLRETKDRAARRDMVRTSFGPLCDRTSTSSDRWTGRPSTSQRAECVLRLGPPALAAIETLIDDEERRRGNGGPVESDRREALAHLREFHSALGDLIRAAQDARPLDAGLDKLKRLRLAAAAATGRAAAAMPVTAGALTAFGAVVGITDLLVGNLVVSLAAGGIAGNTMKDALLKKEARAA